MTARSPNRRGGAGLIAAGLVLGLAAGCLQQVRDEPPQPSPIPRLTHMDLAARGIAKVAVVEPLDRTEQGAGLPVAQALLEALVAAQIPVATPAVRRPGNALARSWLAAQARALGVDGFVTGSVSAFAVQPQRDRAYVAMTATLLDGAGEILWSKRVAGASPLSGLQASLPNEGHLGNNGTSVARPVLDQAGVHQDALAVAATIAAKEFAHDLAAIPQP